jgi:hypothetical protein
MIPSSIIFVAFVNNSLSSPFAYIIDGAVAFNQGFASIGGWHGDSADLSSYSQAWGKLSVFLYYDRHLSEAELRQNYNALRSRFGV